MAPGVERKFLVVNPEVARVGYNLGSLILDTNAERGLRRLGFGLVATMRLQQDYLLFDRHPSGKVLREEFVRKTALLDYNGEEPLEHVEHQHVAKEGVGSRRIARRRIIGEDEYLHLLSGNSGVNNGISKYRTSAQYGKFTLELDRYLGCLTGLAVAEVKFLDTQTGPRFNPEDTPFGDILDCELTSDTRYSNLNLAIAQVLPD